MTEQDTQSDGWNEWFGDQELEGKFELLLQLAIAVALALLVGWIVSLLSTIVFPLFLNYWLLPSTLICGFVWRKPVFFHFLPIFLFGTLAAAFMPLPAYGSAVEGFILVVASLIFLAITGRIQEICCSDSRHFVTEQLEYLPTEKPHEDLPTTALQWGTFVLILVAWLASVVITWSFSRAVASRFLFQVHRQVISSEYGLVPWAYHGIRLVLIFSFLFVVSHGIFSYLRTRHNSGAMSWLLLRHELWKWNRWEQRKIAKLMRKQK